MPCSQGDLLKHRTMPIGQARRSRLMAPVDPPVIESA